MITLRADAPQETATIIVTGVGRSGTSMAAQVLAALGLPMGPTPAATCEDAQLRPALEFYLHADRAGLIGARNAAHPKWGFKFPSLQNHLFPAELRQFRRPRLLVISRDSVSVAQRAVLSDPALGEPVAALQNVTRQQGAMLEFVLAADCPALLVSYERAIRFPRVFVEAVAAFSGLAWRPAAVEAVRADSPAYREVFHGAAGAG